MWPYGHIRSENSTILLYQIQEFRTTDFRISIRKYPTQIYQTARISVHLFPAAADQNRPRDLPAIWAKLWACFTCSGQERIYRVGAGWIATAWTGGASRGAKPLWLWVSNRGEQHPCWHRVSKGKQRCPWHTILLAKYSVLYLLRPLMLERGLSHARQTVFSGSRTGGFCGL